MQALSIFRPLPRGQIGCSELQRNSVYLKLNLLTMKNIYNISKAQFITLWIFGILFFIYAVNLAEYGEAIGGLFVILIPFLLIFYSLGRKNHLKKKAESESKKID